MTDKTCTEMVDDMRDLVATETVNRELWLGFITLFRGVCRTLDRLDRAVFGNGKEDEPGMLKILTLMHSNQQKRSDDPVNFKIIFWKSIFPSIISSLIIGLIAAAAGWWIAVNRMLLTSQMEGGGSIVIPVLQQVLNILP